MGRKKIEPVDKKTSRSVSISKENMDKLTELKINKSKLIDWLLKEHLKVGGQN